MYLYPYLHAELSPLLSKWSNYVTSHGSSSGNDVTPDRCLVKNEMKDTLCCNNRLDCNVN